MRKLFLGSLALGLSVLLTSCGVSYRPVNTSTLRYEHTVAGPKAEISYLQQMQEWTGNRRYAKKERKKAYSAVAVKVTNLTQEKLQLTKENLKISTNGMTVAVVTPEEYTKAVKQVAAAHLLHTLWGPWSYSYTEYPPPGHSEFVFIPIGAVVGIINMAIAATANKKHLTTLRNTQLIGLTVEPGQTVHGIVLMRGTGVEPLTFEIVD